MGLKKQGTPPADTAPEGASQPHTAPAPAAASPEPAPAVKETKARAAADSTTGKRYLSSRHPLRDPYSGITYTRANPMPAGNASWLACQLAAGTIVEAK